jgi:hypothetical protein
MQQPRATFIVVSLSYLVFTLTDGALRMVLLLTAYKYGFSAIEIALMFGLYESLGVVTNVRLYLRMPCVSAVFTVDAFSNALC